MGYRAGPPTIYAFDGNLGDDSTIDASPERPAKTMNRVAAIAMSRGGFRFGDQVWRSGRTTESVNVGSVSGVWHRVWPGREDAAWRGSAPVLGGDWITEDGRTFKALIGPGKHVAICVDRWASRVDSYGRHYGYLRRDPIRPDIDGLPSPGTWHYDEVSGSLFVRLIDDADPRVLMGDDAVMWANGDLWSGLYAQFGTDTIVSGTGSDSINAGSFRQFLSSGNLPCYGLTVCGTRSVVRDLRLDDCSIHHLSILSGSTRDVLVENVSCWGGGLYSGASQFVVYSGGEDISGIVLRNCHAHPYSLLDSAGEPLRFNSNWSPLFVPVSIDGYYAHTIRANGSLVRDMLWDRCTTTFYGDTIFNTNLGTAFNAGDTAPPPADPWNWGGYAARGDRCRIHRGNSDNLFGNLAFRNHFADFTNAKLNPQAYCGSINRATTVLFESSVFVVNSDSNFRRSLYHLFGGARILMVNCTVIDVGEASTSHEIFSTANNQLYKARAELGFNIHAVGCIFYFHRPPAPGRQNRLVSNDLGAPKTNMRFEGCAYYNVSQYSDDPSRDSLAEWRKLDPTGIFGVDPGFVDPLSVDPAVAGRLRTDSPLRTAAYRRVNAIRPTMGYNERAYDGTVGAWQMQAAPRRLP